VFAGSLVSTWSCKYSRFYGYSNCMTTWTRVPDPVRDLEQERLDAIARQKEDAKWEHSANRHSRPTSMAFVAHRMQTRAVSSAEANKIRTTGPRQATVLLSRNGMIS
jgi:hypothetical protein